MSVQRKVIEIQRFKITAKRGGVGVGTTQKIYEDIYLNAIKKAQNIRLDPRRKSYKVTMDDFLPVDQIKQVEAEESFANKLEAKVRENANGGNALKATPIVEEIEPIALPMTLDDLEGEAAKAEPKKRGRKPNAAKEDNALTEKE